MRFRLLTLLIVALSTLMVVKASNLIDKRHTIAALLFAGELQAAQVSGDTKPEDSPAPPDLAPQKEAETPASDASKETDSKAAAPKPGEPLTAEQIIAADKKLSTERPAVVEQRFTKSQIDILERLSIRRKQLEDWEKELSIKENMLNLSQARLQEKIEELRALKSDVEAKLAEYETKEDEKTKSLVKIYENMKPKDAARIFSTMEMETLLTVVENMKERTAAPIIAKMDSEVAKKLTEEFAARGKLPDSLQARNMQ